MPADTALRKAGWQRYDRASGSAEPNLAASGGANYRGNRGATLEGPKKGKLPEMINLEPVLVIGA
jgi:hypothetical protein